MVQGHQQPIPPRSAPAPGGSGAHLLLYVIAVSSSGALRVTCAHVRMGVSESDSSVRRCVGVCGCVGVCVGVCVCVVCCVLCYAGGVRECLLCAVWLKVDA